MAFDAGHQESGGVDPKKFIVIRPFEFSIGEVVKDTVTGDVGTIGLRGYSKHGNGYALYERGEGFSHRMHLKRASFLDKARKALMPKSQRGRTSPLH